jgi:hypothetical protein
MSFYNPQQSNYGGGGGGGGQPSGGMPGADYFKSVSPEMLNFGLNAGQDMFNKQRDKWMPGVSGFWHSLKYYFSVSVRGVMYLRFALDSRHTTYLRIFLYSR